MNELGRVKDVKDLFERFSVEVLTKAFYQELSDWYAWAIKVISFPNDISTRTDDKLHNHEGVIRLITRLIFVWFLKERKLIPWQFFDQEYIANHLIKGFNPHKIDNLFGKSEASVYYRAILQNLFFAMLNCPITKEGSTEFTERRFKDNRSQFDDNKLMRYRDEFNNPDEFLRLANETVPFLNGGLFDCLDEKRSGMYYDGFSERKESMAQLIVPDYLFFGEEAGKNIDLSEFYGDANKKKVSARGIIDILKRYNFTVEENMPFDKDVSLDPELLGKVFENLLASYNPETQQTARKQTGSFYTPREIVQYMVDESLVAHLKRTVGNELEGEYRKLLDYADNETSLTEQQKLAIMQSLYNCKILDPACGSGAFPVGVLQQMVHILKQIDPDNSRWKNMLLQFAIDETSEAYLNSTAEERREAVADIERAFDENVNYPDYARKLHLIENCIYGVDIQPIAIQISKLRFFISLVIDQKRNDNPADNFGIRPLPNLEAKFVAANSLLGLQRTEASLFDSEEIKQKECQLKIAKHKIFSARRPATKEKWRNEVVRLRKEIADLLLEKDCIGNEQAAQLAQWDMFDQNASSPFFDPEWMFNVKEGFDIVIANPPFVLLQNSSISKIEQDVLKSTYQIASYKVDLYHLFIEKGYNLLKNFGVLCYINPSNFLTNNYAEKLRLFILNNSSINFIVNIIDNVFEASVNTCIMNFVKRNGLNHIVDYYKGELINNRLLLTLLSHLSHNEYRNNIGAVIQPLGDDRIIRLLSKIETISFPLKNFATVNFGMQLRNRKIFPNDVLHNPQISELTQYHRKCITGKDIHEYCVIYDNRYCYFNRIAKCGGCWDEEVQSAGTKLLVRQVGAVPICGIELNGYAVLNSAFIVIATKINPYILLGLINSHLLQFFWSYRFEDKRKTFPKIKGAYLELLPIVYTENKNLETAVRQIVKYKSQGGDVTDLLYVVDKIVYQLYDLTYDEVLIVDPQTPITREQYES